MAVHATFVPRSGVESQSEMSFLKSIALLLQATVKEVLDVACSIIPDPDLAKKVTGGP